MGCESQLLAMRKSMSVCYVFSFGEKVSGFGFQVSGSRNYLNTDTSQLNSITNNLDLHPGECGAL